MRSTRFGFLVFLFIPGLLLPAQGLKKKKVPKKPNPQVKIKIKEMASKAKGRGRFDGAAAALIRQLGEMVKEGADADKKDLAKALGKILSKKRKPGQVLLFTETAKVLATLGDFGAKTLIVSIKKNFRKKAWLQVKAGLVRSLGKTKSMGHVKSLIDLLKNKDDQVIAAAVDGLANYNEAPQKIRKTIVKKVIGLYESTSNGASSTDPNDMMATVFKNRLQLIAGPCNTTLKLLTPTAKLNLTKSLDWLKWWNHNKGKKWPEKKGKQKK